jgi:peptide/nickel transport system substrate-binding protein
MKNLRVLLISLVIVMLFSSALSQAEAKTIVYGTTERVKDLDPASGWDFHVQEIFLNVYPSLLTYIPGTNEIVPGLAESYSISNNGKEYTFSLKKGLKFPDGTPFDANVVKYSIDRVVKIKGNPSYFVADYVDRVVPVDTHTVRFILKKPVAFFPALVSMFVYAPVNPNQYPSDKSIPFPSQLKGGKMAGLGPYQIVSFKRDEEIVLEANPYCYGEKPKTDRIVIRYFTDATTMRLSLERGELDLAYKTLNPSDIHDLRKSKNIREWKAKAPVARFLCFLCDTPPFNDKILRQAIAAAIDRPPIVKKVFLGLNFPLYSMIAEGLWPHIDTFNTTLGDGNIAKTKELLASRGYNESNKLAFDLWYTTSHYGDTEIDVAAILKEQFEGTGCMKVNIKSAEWATYIKNWQNKQMPAYLLGGYPDYLDPDNMLTALGGTSGSAGIGIFHSNSSWDAKLEEGRVITDVKKRKAIYEDLQRLWTEEVPTVPIFQTSLYLFAQKDIEGINFIPTGCLIYSNISKGK